MADISAIAADYPRAIKNYEKVAQMSINNNLMRYSVKDYFLKAGLCHLDVDVLSAQRAISNYRDMEPAFSREKECMLLENLTEAVDKGSETMFTDVLFDYDRTSRLDPWKTTMCLRIKNKLQAKEEEEVADEFS